MSREDELIAAGKKIMRVCYDEANRLANHGHGGHDRWVMENLYAAANEARKIFGYDRPEEPPKPPCDCGGEPHGKYCSAVLSGAVTYEEPNPNHL